MNGRTALSIVLVLVVIALVGGAGVYAFNAGVAQGLAQSGKLTPPAAGIAPYPYYGPFFYRPFGFFGIFGCLFPLLFLFLLFALFRAILWRGGWGWRGGRGYPGEGVPSRFDEWHRRAHESNPETRNT